MVRFRYFSALLLAMVLLAPSLVAQPINDDVRTHAPIYGSVTAYTGSNVGATTDATTPSCGLNANNGVWWAIAPFPSTDRTITFDTFGSDFDTVLSIWRWENGAPTQIACNDDTGGPGERQSEVTATLTAGSTNLLYLVYVSGYNGATGNISLNVDPELALDFKPPHDRFRRAPNVPNLLPGGSHSGAMVGADDGGSIRSDCGVQENTDDIWRTFVAPASGFVTIDTFGSEFDTILGIWDPGEFNAGTEITCDDDAAGTLQSEIVNFAVSFNQTYYVRVSKFSQAISDGLVTLNISAVTGSPVASEETAVAGSVALASAYPNPFADRTTLDYVLPTAQEVRVVAYDVLGREVAVLAEGIQSAGEHEVTFDAAGLPSGLYVVRLTAGKTTLTRRVTVVR